MDADQSGSMFEDVTGLDDMHIFITTSANALQGCTSRCWIEEWNTFLTTAYSAAWMDDRYNINNCIALKFE